MAYTEEEWAIRKKAVVEFSRLSPLLLLENLVPIPNQKNQAMPATAFGIFSIDYGVEESLINVITEDTGGVTGWNADTGVLYITPAPADATPITTIWKSWHQPDEDTQTFPTIPVQYEVYIDYLCQAIELEDFLSGALQGPLKYSIGQETVDQTSTPEEVRKLVSSLREKVYMAFSAPSMSWA